MNLPGVLGSIRERERQEGREDKGGETTKTDVLDGNNF